MTTLAPPPPQAADPRSYHPSRHQPSIAILSTYPPTQCGLATFSSALATGLATCGVREIGVVSVGEPENLTETQRVVAQLIPHDALSVARVATVLNRYDIVIVQHEYGIYGGHDGDELLEVMKRVRAPMVTTLHTVPLQPTAHQKHVLEQVVELSDCAVTMTAIARQRLLAVYEVDASRVVTVPHGATIPQPVAPSHEPLPQVLTWGLLGPGKGIEWVIDALALLRADEIEMRYVVAGRTHPKVKATHGEEYRTMLQKRARARGVDDLVEFDSEYRSLDSLLALIAQSTCVVLPYESIDQITSGVLVDAIAAGRPVVATAFPHAVELLSGGAGLLVPPRNPHALHRALARVATDRNALCSMSERATALAPMHNWVTVAGAYRRLGEGLLHPPFVEVLA